MSGRRITSGLEQAVEIARWPIRRDGTQARVELKDYGGRALVDVRAWWPDKAGMHRPGKGFACGVQNLPALAKAVGKALEKARALGLIDEASA